MKPLPAPVYFPASIRVPLSLPALIFLFFAIMAAAVFMLTVGCSFYQPPFCSVVLDNYIYLGSGAIHLFLISAAMLFLWKKDLATTLKAMGVSRDVRSHVLFTAIGLTALFTVMFWLQLASMAIGFNDQQKVVEKVAGLPFLVLVLAVVVAPVTEELFFRAMLVPRTGILLSSLLFGLLHFSYGSVVEIVGVFVIALLLGAIFRISKSVVPCIAIHLIYNLLSIVAMKLMT